MWNQIMLLTKIQLLGMFGFNQVRYGRDTKKRNRFLVMGFSMLLVGIMVAAYVVMFTVGFLKIGMGSIVPSYIMAIISLMILFFTMFKAGSVIFQMSTYEMLISLPVKPAAIVISRFINMYIMNLLICLLTMIPVAVVYGIMAGPGFLFYVMLLLGAVLIPLLPMTIATAAGAVIMAISSRMKHKNLVVIILTIGFVVGTMFLTFSFSSKVSNDAVLDISSIESFAVLIQGQIHSVYPPATLFTAAVVNGNIVSFLVFAGISCGTFLVLVYLVQRKFVSICNALSSKKTNGNYKLQELHQKSPLLALYKRDMARYFASSLYVMNTAMGPVLMLVLAVGIAFTGVEKMEQMLEMPGIISMALPMLLGCISGLNSSTSCAISIEGKQWWIVKNLPVTSKQIFDSKIMVNLTMAIPCYIISEAALLIGLRPQPALAFWMLLMPLVYIFFSSVLGLTLNLKMPVFQWESETAVIKQGGAVFMGIIISMVVSIGPILALFFLTEIPSAFIMGITAVLLTGAGAFMYLKNNKIDIRSVE